MWRRNRQGYGKQSGVGAHRVAWEMANGPIPPGAFVLHRCDNPPCVRPDHLFLGTHAENMRDMVAKRRDHRRFGAENNAAKLTESDVIDIRTLHAFGAVKAKLARAFGVCESNIGAILARRVWRHVP
jgi:hypothetical protein